MKNDVPKIMEIIRKLFLEYDRACEIHPEWQDDMIHQAAIVSEEAGELVKAVNNHIWHKGGLHMVEEEAIHTGAMAIRFLINLKYNKEGDLKK